MNETNVGIKDLLKDPLIIKILVGIVVVIIFSVASYSISSKRKETRSLEAREKVLLEREKLKEMNAIHKAEMAAIAQIEEQFNTLRNSVVFSTDIFFKDADSESPEFILKTNDKSVESDMNRRRLEITRIFKSWDKKMSDLDSLSPDTIPTLSDIVSIAREDIEYVQQYINDLKDIVGGLNPSTSGITQAQIDSYQSVVEASANQLEQLVSNIDTIEDNIAEIYEPGSTNGNDNPVIATNDAPNVLTPTPTPTPTPPIITPEQIQNQEEVVNQAENEANQQTATSTTPVTPTPPPAPTSTPVTEPYVYYYYPTTPQYGGTQTILEYLQSLPSNNLDRTGWPDNVADTNKPLLLDGASQ